MWCGPDANPLVTLQEEKTAATALHERRLQQVMQDLATETEQSQSHAAEVVSQQEALRLLQVGPACLQPFTCLTKPIS